MNATEQQIIKSLSGKSIKSATSWLDCFTIEFENNEGLCFRPAGSGADPDIEVVLCQASDLPKPTEAVCSVDWSWIYGSTISAAAKLGERVQLKLNPAGPLNVWTGFWQGKPFLAFQPHQKP